MSPLSKIAIATQRGEDLAMSYAIGNKRFVIHECLDDPALAAYCTLQLTRISYQTAEQFAQALTA